MSSGAQSENDAVLESNVGFYRAFAAGDITAMEGLWAKNEALLCIHPGAPPLYGRIEVMESWHDILSDPPPIEFSEARVEIVRGVGFVTCLEQIGSDQLAATNVFVWEDGRWRLTHHQASGLRPLPPMAMPPGSNETVH